MKTLQIYTLSVVFLLSSMGFGQNKSDTKSKRPNILFCVADDVTFNHMGAYGNTWVKTPAFDSVASQGLLFSNAYTPNAKCAPSRSCIVTGRNSWQLEQAGNHWSYFPTKFKTYAEVLIENGYHVGVTAKGVAPVVALTTTGEKRMLLGKEFNNRKTTPPTKEISNIDYAANFAQFLDEKADNTPFCFWYGSNEPHRRYEYGSGIKKGHKSLSDINSDEIFPFWPDKETVRNDMLDYAFEIEYFDAHLGRMLKMLKDRKMLDNTVVIVTADNGMPFPRVKGQAYEYSNHLPLAIMWKNGIRQPGRVVEDFVSFIDFAPTLLELAGVAESTSGMQPIQGKSFTNLFSKDNTASPHRDHVLIGKERHDVGRPHDWGYPIRGIRKGDYLYVINFKPERWPAGNPETGYLNTDGSATKTQILADFRQESGVSFFWSLCFGKRPRKELYNVIKDPACVNNLAERPELSKLVEDLETRLIGELKAQQDPRMFGNGDVFDNYLYSYKRDRNFYERQMSGEKMNASWVNPSDFESMKTLKKKHLVPNQTD